MWICWPWAPGLVPQHRSRMAMADNQFFHQDKMTSYNSDLIHVTFSRSPGTFWEPQNRLWGYAFCTWALLFLKNKSVQYFENKSILNFCFQIKYFNQFTSAHRSDTSSFYPNHPFDVYESVCALWEFRASPHFQFPLSAFHWQLNDRSASCTGCHAVPAIMDSKPLEL